MDCEHVMATTYVGDRQTISIDCNGQRIGSLQQRVNKFGDWRWLPVAGESLTGELPTLDDTRFPTTSTDTLSIPSAFRPIGANTPRVRTRQGARSSKQTVRGSQRSRHSSLADERIG